MCLLLSTHGEDRNSLCVSGVSERILNTQRCTSDTAMLRKHKGKTPKQHNLRNFKYARWRNEGTRGKETPLQSDCTTEQRQLLQIRPPRTPAGYARMICGASTDTVGTGRRKQSMSSIIKQGFWPLTQLISSVYVSFRVVSKRHKMGDWVSWPHAIAISNRDRSVGAGKPACKEEERCWFWIFKHQQLIQISIIYPEWSPALAHPRWVSPNTMPRKNKAHILLLYLEYYVVSGTKSDSLQ